MGKQTKKRLAMLFTFCFVIILSVTAVSTGQVAYQDTEWKSSYDGHLMTIRNDLSGLSKGYLNKDMPNLKMYSIALSIDSQKALVASKQFSVSPSLQPAKNEYETALSDLEQVGNYYAKGTTESQNGESDQASKDFNTAKSYLRSAAIHLVSFYKFVK